MPILASSAEFFKKMLFVEVITVSRFLIPLEFKSNPMKEMPYLVVLVDVSLHWQICP